MSSVRNVRPFETSIRTKRLPETKYVRTKCLRAKRLRAKRLPCETSIRTKRLLAVHNAPSNECLMRSASLNIISSSDTLHWGRLRWKKKKGQSHLVQLPLLIIVLVRLKLENCIKDLLSLCLQFVGVHAIQVEGLDADPQGDLHLLLDLNKDAENVLKCVI